MRPIQITLEGFLSFREETTFQFDGLTFVAITGHNGAGKSAVINGLAWIAYGETRLAGDKDSVVNDREETARGVLDVEANDGTRWRIERIRYWNSKTELTVAQWDEDKNEWITFGDHRIATAQEQIFRIMGMDEPAFYSLMVTKQSSMAGGTAFTAASSDQRRAILMGLTPELAKWGSLEAAAADELYDVNVEIKQATDSIDNLTGRIDRQKESLKNLEDKAERDGDADAMRSRLEALEREAHDLEEEISQNDAGRAEKSSRLRDLKNQRRAREAERDAEISRLKSEITEIRSVDSQIATLRDEIARNEERLSTAKDRIGRDTEELESVRDGLAQARKDAEEASAESSAIQERVTRLRQNREDVENRLQALELQLEHGAEDGKCLVCESPLTHKQLLGLQNKAKDEKSALRGDLRDAEQEMAEQRRVETRVVDRLHSLERQEATLQNSIEQATSRLVSYPTTIEDLSKRIQTLKDSVSDRPSIRELEDRIDSLKPVKVSQEEQKLQDDIEEADRSNPLGRQLSQVRADVNRLRQALADRDQLTGRIDSGHEALSSFKKERRNLKKDLDALTQRQEALSWVKQACSQKGIPTLLITDLLVEIEERQNALLSRLMGDRAMQVEFRQEKELKTRDATKAALDIIVHTQEGYERPIESFSGGEQVRLTLSNLFAMLQVFNTRNGGMVDTLFLDEPFGHLDEDTIPIVIEIIRDALENKIVESVFVVSHDPRVLDQLPQKVFLSYDHEAKTSVIEVI